MARAEIGVLQNRAHPSGIIGGIDEKVQVAVDRLGARDAVRQDDCLSKVGGDDGRTFAQRLRQPEAGQRKVADGAILRLLEERRQRNAELLAGHAGGGLRGGSQRLNELFHNSITVLLKSPKQGKSPSEAPRIFALRRRRRAFCRKSPPSVGDASCPPAVLLSFIISFVNQRKGSLLCAARRSRSPAGQAPFSALLSPPLPAIFPQTRRTCIPAARALASRRLLRGRP